jgi:hypothetical protein
MKYRSHVQTSHTSLNAYISIPYSSSAVTTLGKIPACGNLATNPKLDAHICADLFDSSKCNHSRKPLMIGTCGKWPDSLNVQKDLKHASYL